MGSVRMLLLLLLLLKVLLLGVALGSQLLLVPLMVGHHFGDDLFRNAANLEEERTAYILEVAKGNKN